MEIAYKVPVSNAFTRQDSKPYLRWYLAGLHDAGAILAEAAMPKTVF